MFCGRSLSSETSILIPRPGNSWYDSLQMKLNARLRHNITALGTYTWAKSITRTGHIQRLDELRHAEGPGRQQRAAARFP